MKNLEIITELKNTSFIDEDGASYQLEFQNGLSDQEINQLKEKFPNGTIDRELIEILKYTKGWDGIGPEMVYFDSIGEFGFEELSPYSLTLGHDGFGNMWVLDINQNGRLGKVFFACHDPAVFVIHSQSLNEYLGHLLEFYKKPEQSYLNEIHEKTVMDIWNINEYCLSKNDFLKSNPEYDNFLKKYEGNDWTIADLRTGQNRKGFAWGKFGPNNLTERHPTDLLWVLKNKSKNFFTRLFQ